MVHTMYRCWHSNMDAMSSEDLIHAQRMVFHHSLSFITSMALKCAVDLGIPEAIHLHGGSATIADIVAGIRLHESRLPYVKRLMNVLAVSGVFASSDSPATSGNISSEKTNNSGEAAVYRLTPMSRLLVDSNKAGSMSPMVQFLVNPLTVTTFFDMHAWLKDEKPTAKTFFELTHGCSRYEMARKNAEDNALYNNAMVSASHVSMEIILREAGTNIFGGLRSLMDVGGGHGMASAAITAAFPHVKCTVLDLPHVVDQAPANGAVQFIAGDMFEFIPKADAVLLKWVLHCWDDEDSVKILRRCREAIAVREAGGKVIIIDAVMQAGLQDTFSKETQILYDFHMMHIDGMERDKHGWENIILEAGFRGCKIVSVLGLHSVIEAYP